MLPQQEVKEHLNNGTPKINSFPKLLQGAKTMYLEYLTGQSLKIKSVSDSQISGFVCKQRVSVER